MIQAPTNWQGAHASHRTPCSGRKRLDAFARLAAAIALVCTALAGATTSMGAAVAATPEPYTFAFAMLEELYERLALDEAVVVRERRLEDAALQIRIVRTTLHDRPTDVKLHVNDSRHVTHIGFAFFSPEEITALEPIGLFIERQLLAYHTKEREGRIASMRSDQVQIMQNGVVYGTLGFTSFDAVLGVIEQRTSYAIETQTVGDVHWYVFNCIDSDGNELRIDFPARYDLISGRDQEELDTMLGGVLQALPAAEEAPATWAPPDPALLIPYAETLYKLPGPQRYEGLHADLFFVQDGTELHLLHDADYPLEHLSNLLLRPVITDSVTLNLTHVRYGSRQETFRIDLARLVQYLYQDYDVHVGFERRPSDNIFAADTSSPPPPVLNPAPERSLPGILRATVLFTHRRFTHLHLMVLDWPLELLSQTGARAATARLYTYIRQDNVNNLFAPYKERSGKKIPLRLKQ